MVQQTLLFIKKPKEIKFHQSSLKYYLKILYQNSIKHYFKILQNHPRPAIKLSEFLTLGF